MTATSLPGIFSGSEFHWHALFENAPFGIAQCDGAGTILEMNSALGRMLGSRSLNLNYICFQEFFPAEDRDLVQGMFQQLMNGERDSFEIEGKCVPSGNETSKIIWKGWMCSAGNSNSVILFADTPVDASSVSPDENAHLERFQTLGRMAAGITHDFNNLLNGILLYCDLILDTLAAEPQRQENNSGNLLNRYAHEIRSATLQATGIVQQVLSFARPRSLASKPVSLNAVIEETSSLMRQLIGRNIDLSLQLDPALNLVTLDPAQVQQVLLNLVLNARDAMPGGGNIAIETRNCSLEIFSTQEQNRLAPLEIHRDSLLEFPFVWLGVIDNGAGIEEEARRNAFRSCFTTKPEGRGTGLGLITVHDIVTSSGGLVQIENVKIKNVPVENWRITNLASTRIVPEQSTPTGKRGTRVTVLLPSARAPGGAPSKQFYVPPAV